MSAENRDRQYPDRWSQLVTEGDVLGVVRETPRAYFRNVLSNFKSPEFSDKIDAVVQCVILPLNLPLTLLGSAFGAGLGKAGLVDLSK